MASEFADYDSFNVVGDHVLQALKADTLLKTGGALAIKTWELEARGDAGEYNDSELIAVSVDIGLYAHEVVTIGDRLENGFLGVIMVITAGGNKRLVKQKAKRIAARVVRVMQQQHLYDQQLKDLPASLAGGEPDSVYVEIQDMVVDSGTVDRTLRGVAAIQVGIAVEINMPED